MSRLLDLIKNNKCENRKEIIAEAEKYEWHDLRKDPSDLPKEPKANNPHDEYLVLNKWGEVELMWFDFERLVFCGWVTKYNDGEALAWKEVGYDDIEPFKE